MHANYASRLPIDNQRNTSCASPGAGSFAYSIEELRIREGATLVKPKMPSGNSGRQHHDGWQTAVRRRSAPWGLAPLPGRELRRGAPLGPPRLGAARRNAGTDLRLQMEGAFRWWRRGFPVGRGARIFRLLGMRLHSCGPARGVGSPLPHQELQPFCELRSDMQVYAKRTGIGRFSRADL